MEIKRERLTLTVFGAGYVGLVTAACFAKLGYTVLCADVNAEKIAELQQGKVAIYEPGLSRLVQDMLAAQRLKFTADIPAAVQNGI